jgi:hypothetical protein
MYPHLGLILDGRIGHEAYLVPILKVADQSITSREYRPVDRRAKVRRASFRKRRARSLH